MSSDGFATKAIGPADLDEERGEVEAVVATYGVVDQDGDVILEGAIPPRSRVWISSFGHDVTRRALPPAGRGFIEPDGSRAMLRGRFFVDTDRGREAFRVVKNLGPDGEWSIGFPERSVRTVPLTERWRQRGARRVIKSVEPLEVSPVFMAAGFGTGTVAAKCSEPEPDSSRSPELRAALAAVRERRLEEHLKWFHSEFGPSTETHVNPERHAAATYLARWAAGAWGIRAPRVRWFPRRGHKSSGYQFPGCPDEIWLCTGLTGWGLAELAFHETTHAAREVFGLSQDEAEVRADAAALLERYRREVGALPDG